MRTLAITLLLVFSSVAAADPAQLANDRAAQAAKIYATIQAKAATTPAEDQYRWSVRWLDAQLDAQPKTAAKAFADHAKRMATTEASATALFKSSLVSDAEVAMATYFRIEADLWAARGKK